ncbi:unnamed protein product [Ranitomeya imitator]|uniref:Ig-like domain-containing protein n=1 Tax=Ranitomeya imitator TaxID=111125 RepID=A0ABN9MQ75_9NEOB|nr:unnamed protein product [Ranitomeya imitator]
MDVTSGQISIRLIPQYPVTSGSVTLSVTGINAKLELVAWYKGADKTHQNLILTYVPGNSPPILFPGLLHNDRISVFNNGTSLHITDLCVTDGGNYIVAALALTSALEFNVILNVYDGPDKVQMKGASFVRPGSSITLTCSADSVPPPEYQWKLNGTDIQEKSSKYAISKAAPEDEGLYTCVVRNTVTLRTATDSVYVNVTTEYIEYENSTGLIIGLTIGAILGGVLIIIISVFLYRKILTKKKKEASGNRKDHINVYENVMIDGIPVSYVSVCSTMDIVEHLYG